MESSNQQSSDTGSADEFSLEESKGADAAFYEFPSAPSEQVFAVASGISGQEIQPGVPYPPPPSFYENMPEPEEAPARPLPAPIPPVGQPSGVTFKGVPVSQVPYQYQFQPGRPPVLQATPPARRSRKPLWIVLSIVGTILLLSCVICGVAGTRLFAPAIQDATSITNVVTDYYQKISDHQYNAAYADLQISNLTQSSYLQQAQQRDSQFGAVSSFNVTGVSASSTFTNQNILVSTYAITLTATRGSNSYTVHLTLQKIAGNWKITSFDTI